jgi:hypothetical protein
MAGGMRWPVGRPESFGVPPNGRTRPAGRKHMQRPEDAATGAVVAFTAHRFGCLTSTEVVPGRVDGRYLIPLGWHSLGH